MDFWSAKLAYIWKLGKGCEFLTETIALSLLIIYPGFLLMAKAKEYAYQLAFVTLPDISPYLWVTFSWMAF